MEQLTVLVSSCDKYADILPGFVQCFRKYWPNCQYPVALVTETTPKPLDTTFFHSCYAQKTSWAERLLAACRQIETPYVFLLLDDFFVNDVVDSAAIEKALKIMAKNNMGHLRLAPLPKPQCRIPGTKLGNTFCGEYQRGKAYRVSAQVALWNRAYLMRLLQDLGTGELWYFERQGSFLSERYEETCAGTYDDAFPYIEIICGARWLAQGLRFCRRESLPMQYAIRPVEPTWYLLYREARGVIFRLNPTLVTKIKLSLQKGTLSR